jgi:hypothetical protein
MGTPIKSCCDYAGAPPCCISCHEDAEEQPYGDYPLCQIEKNGEIIAEVCCAVIDFARKIESPNM